MNTFSPRSSGSDPVPAARAEEARRTAPRGGSACALILALAAALLLAASAEVGQAAFASAAVPWHEAYRMALADADLENWEGVVTKIRAAIAENPRSDRNVRMYGMWHSLYIPHYYLGLAQYHLGRHDEALNSLQREEAARVVQHDPVAFLKLRRMIAAIRSGTPAKAASPATAPPSPAASQAAPPAADNVVEGLQAFFQGDYTRSAKAFQQELKKAPKDDLTLHLYLGMAYAGKATEDAAQKDLWRNLAVLEFQSVHAIDPNYTLATGVFSEEMVNLFKEANAK